MKITQQIIAAAGFASLLFAPLTQAQEQGGNVGLTVIADGLTVSGTELNFGQATLNEADTAGFVSLACLDFGGDLGMMTILSAGEPRIGTDPNHNVNLNLFSLIAGDAACGNVTVTADNADLTYQLRAEVTALTGSGGGSISPNLTLFEADGTNQVVTSFTPTSPASSGNLNIVANASASFVVAGTLPIAPNQATEDFTGSYTITALVQTTP